ncbi:MAG: DinB family protein [Nitrospinae bacterium]|nr:DinB family protein [Nitrospinota bacterium]
MRMIDPILQELAQEGATTRKFLEQVPGDKLSWKPHEKSLSLGQLSRHIATIPCFVAEMVKQERFEFPESLEFQSAETAEELAATLEEGLKKAREILGQFDDQALMVTWKLMKGGKEIMALPKIVVIRSVMLNHWYHHRGQLGVYLRLLGAKVPSSYGPSADENPM